MASEADIPESSSLLERLINSRNRSLSFFLPIILDFTNNPNITNPDQDSSERSGPDDPSTQRMFVMEGSSEGIDSLLRDILGKDGQPPASKASIEAMPRVETKEGDGECVICLEEWEGGELAREMPCKHKFHGKCIEKWLNIHGSCPVCRYKMPVDDDQDIDHKCPFGSEERGRRRREIWISVSFSSGDTNWTASNESETSTPEFDTEMLD